MILLFSYSYKIDRDGKDELLEEAFLNMENFSNAVMPGAFFVDMIPQREVDCLRKFPPLILPFSQPHSIVVSRRKLEAYLGKIQA